MNSQWGKAIKSSSVIKIEKLLAFYTVSESTAPEVIIDSPALVVKEKRFNLSGKVEGITNPQGVSLSIDGMKYNVKPDNSFSIPLVKKDGRYVLDIYADDGKGKISSHVLKHIIVDAEKSSTNSRPRDRQVFNTTSFSNVTRSALGISKIYSIVPNFLSFQTEIDTNQTSILDIAAGISSLLPTPNTFVSGAVNCTVYVNDEFGIQSVLFVYSSDGGLTWQQIEKLDKPTFGTFKAGAWSTSLDTVTKGISGDILIRATVNGAINTFERTNEIHVDNVLPIIDVAEITNLNYSPEENDSLKIQSVSYKINEDVNVTVQILTENSELVATLTENQFIQGDQSGSLAWNGHYENNFDSEFVTDGNYYARIQATDKAGNVALAANLRFSYDRTKPSAITYEPVSSNVSIYSWPRVIFSEDINPETINANNFSLKNLITGNVFPCSIYYDALSRTAYMQSNVPMESNTLYEVTLGQGIKDLAGNRLDKLMKWQFYTEQTNGSPIMYEYNPGEYKGIAKIALQVQDAGKVENVTVEYSQDGITWASIPDKLNLAEGNNKDGIWETTWDTQGMQGQYFMRIIARDDEGNSTTYKYNVDIIKTDKVNIGNLELKQKVNLMDNEVSIDIPAQAVENVQEIMATQETFQALPKMPITKVFVGRAFNFKALDAAGDVVEDFKKPLQVTMSYDLTGKDFLDESSIAIYYFNPNSNSWEKMISQLDQDKNTVSAQLPHFSLYAVLAEGKRIYLPTVKYKIYDGGLAPVFNTDNISRYPFEIYLPNEQVPSNYRIHSNYTRDTDTCASCHSTHTAVGENLLQWYTVYDTCMACHDGTVASTYNVVEGTIANTGMPTYGGAFGLGDEQSLSRHNVRGGVRNAMAPGGTVTAVTYHNYEGEENENISWQVDFSCDSCHEPHGSGGNARLLNPDPNGAARRNWIGGQFVNDDRVGLTRDVTDWTRIVVDDGSVSGIKTVKYVVYPYRKAEGNSIIRDTQQKPLTWLTGYPYFDPETHYTKITDSVYSDGIPFEKFTVDNSNGYTYIIFSKNLNNPKENEYVPEDDDPNVKMNFIASVRVTMDIKNYLQWNEKINLGTGMNYFCAGCHQDYNTATAAFFVYDSLTYSNPLKLSSGVHSQSVRHQMGMNWNGENETVGNATYNVSKLRFEEDPWGRSEYNQIVNCLTCHFAHGTSTDYWQKLFGPDGVLKEQEIYVYTNESLIEEAGSSSLKRLPNNELCITCHPESVNGSVYQPADADPAMYTQDNATYIGSSKDTCGNDSCHPKQYTGWEETQHKVAGVTCEDCHGPASVHAEVYSELNITVPYNLSKPKQTDICGQCHIRGVNIENSVVDSNYGFRPGQDDSLLSVIYPYSYDGRYYRLTDNKDYYSIANATYMMSVTNYSYLKGNEYTDFIQSKHYTSLAISCNTCHSPHGVNDIGLSLNTDGFSICATCHDTLGGDSKDWKAYIDTHMPEVDDNGIKFRTHSFP